MPDYFKSRLIVATFAALALAPTVGSAQADPMQDHGISGQDPFQVPQGQFRFPHEILRDDLEEIHLRPFREDMAVMGYAESQPDGVGIDHDSLQLPPLQEV